MIRYTMGRLLMITACALSLLACGDTQMTLLDEELNRYKYEQEQYRAESLEELYYEESMRCEELTAEILVVQEQIERKTVELGEIKARLAEIEAQLAEAKKQLAAAEKAAAPKKPPAKAPAKQPAKQPEKAPAKPPAKK
jgi:hypothetical protein